MTTNLTLRIDQNLLRELRLVAAQEGTSVNRLMNQQIEKLVRDRKGYDAARRRALARLKKGMNLGWRPSNWHD